MGVSSPASMGDNVPLLQSRFILGQVLARVCFVETRESLKCKMKDLESDCADEQEALYECQSTIVDDLADQEMFVQYRDCLENNEFHFDACIEEKAKFSRCYKPQTIDINFI